MLVVVLDYGFAIRSVVQVFGEVFELQKNQQFLLFIMWNFML